jgi:hypothetical protein
MRCIRNLHESTVQLRHYLKSLAGVNGCRWVDGKLCVPNVSPMKQWLQKRVSTLIVVIAGSTATFQAAAATTIVAQIDPT